MADPTDAPNDETQDAKTGPKTDADQVIDAIEILDGSGSGSDTRAGSLRGGSASGSDDDPDSEVINRALAAEGRAAAGETDHASGQPPSLKPGGIKNTGAAPGETSTPATRGGDNDADAATG